MFRFIIFLLWLSTAIAFANPIDDKCPQHVYSGAPVSKIQTNSQYLCRTNYAVHYRYDTKTAEYVVEHVTNVMTEGKAKREDDFRPDPEISKEHQSQLKDYAGHPYDRGHLAPAGNNTQNDKVMSESFLLSNMVPQVPNHNRGIWKSLETHVRDWVYEGKDLYVISGTIYSKTSKTIGDNKVGVPDKLFKVIIDKANNKAISFILPNKEIPVADLVKYVTTIREVENETGITFSPLLLSSSKLKTTIPFLSDWPGVNK